MMLPGDLRATQGRARKVIGYSRTERRKIKEPTSSKWDNNNKKKKIRKRKEKEIWKKKSGKNVNSMVAMELTFFPDFFFFLFFPMEN